MQSRNPSLVQSGNFIKEIYDGTGTSGNTIGIQERCKKSIFDYQYALEDSDGTIKKTKKKNETTGVTYEEFGHASDANHYIITTAFAGEHKIFLSKKKSSIGVLSGIR
ncbi:hypothetical protein ACJVDH_15945 [Pedobacter sp. AW1-32]|uniref:hypothetical protein n=1 Tax=Pedobacter sp. AW1-32 TaxID=3383026 RepID=UPI003FF08C96